MGSVFSQDLKIYIYIYIFFTSEVKKKKVIFNVRVVGVIPDSTVNTKGGGGCSMV